MNTITNSTDHFNTGVEQEILSKAGRVSDYTLQNFFAATWINVFVSAIVMGVFLLYRECRKDDDTFKRKLKSHYRELRAKSKPPLSDLSGSRLETESSQSGESDKRQVDSLSDSDDSEEDADSVGWSYLGKNFQNMSWVNQLYACDEDTVIALMGRDVAIYLKYLKYTATMFLVIFCLSFAVLIPLYWSGEDGNIYYEQFVNSTTNATLKADDQFFNATKEFGLTERDAGYNLIMITILNIQRDDSKLLLSYAFVYLTTFIAYFFTFRFWRQTTVWRHHSVEKGEDAHYSVLKNFVVLVRGIPQNLDPECESTAIKRILTRTYMDQLIDFKIVGQYAELHLLGTRWERLCE